MAIRAERRAQLLPGVRRSRREPLRKTGRRHAGCRSSIARHGSITPTIPQRRIGWIVSDPTSRHGRARVRVGDGDVDGTHGSGRSAHRDAIFVDEFEIRRRRRSYEHAIGSLESGADELERRACRNRSKTRGNRVDLGRRENRDDIASFGVGVAMKRPHFRSPRNQRRCVALDARIVDAHGPAAAFGRKDDRGVVRSAAVYVTQTPPSSGRRAGSIARISRRGDRRTVWRSAEPPGVSMRTSTLPTTGGSSQPRASSRRSRSKPEVPKNTRTGSMKLVRRLRVPPLPNRSRAHARASAPERTRILASVDRRRDGAIRFQRAGVTAERSGMNHAAKTMKEPNPNSGATRVSFAKIVEYYHFPSGRRSIRADCPMGHGTTAFREIERPSDFTARADGDESRRRRHRVGLDVSPIATPGALGIAVRSIVASRVQTFIFLTRRLSRNFMRAHGLGDPKHQCRTKRAIGSTGRASDVGSTGRFSVVGVRSLDGAVEQGGDLFVQGVDQVGRAHHVAPANLVLHLALNEEHFLRLDLGCFVHGVTPISRKILGATPRSFPARRPSHSRPGAGKVPDSTADANGTPQNGRAAGRRTSKWMSSIRVNAFLATLVLASRRPAL